MSEHSGKDDLAEWLIETSEQLNGHWQDIMEAEQAGFKPEGSHLQSDRIQSIAAQARSNVRRYRSELAGLKLSQGLNAVKGKCDTCLDNWDSFFYYMAKYDTSGDLDDLGSATRSYKAVDVGLSGILAALGLASAKGEEASMYPQAQQLPAVSTHQVREKEIIREKEVIVKVKCPYCQGLYNETLDKCPRCGAKR